MEDTFVTVEEIAERWGLGYAERLAILEDEAAPDFAQLGDATRQARLLATLQRRAAYDVVHDEVNRFKFKGPAPHPDRSRTRGVLGLTGKQFEKATVQREAFDIAEAAKPPPPPKRRPVTPAEFEKIKADAVANGFMDLRTIGTAWGMKWAKTLEHMHFLDPTVKDTVQLIQGAIEKMDIPQSERRGLYPEEFNRLTLIRNQRQAAEEAARQERRAKVDAETQRLRAENERMKKARQEHFEAWDRRLKDARALVEVHWTEYNAAVLVSRNVRAAAILKAEAEHKAAVDPLIAELQAQVEELGEEPEDGPRFSEASENWWTWQHKRNNLTLVIASKTGIHNDILRELIEDARTEHRQNVWGLRKKLRADIKAPKLAAYKIFKAGPGPFDKSQFDLKSRV